MNIHDAIQHADEVAACGSSCGLEHANLSAWLRELIVLRSQRDELLAALECLHKVCELALTSKDDKQYAYFETRGGSFVHAADAMADAESAISSVKGCAA